MDSANSLTILIIDDDADCLHTLRKFLEARGHRVLQADCGREGLAALESEQVHMVVTDLRMSGVDGFGVLREVRQTAPETEVVIATGYGDMEAAVRALREGASDFFTKPIDLQGLSAALARTERLHAVRREKERYRERLERMGADSRQANSLSAMVGDSAAIVEVRRKIEEVAQADATTVLITGETGTGKELVARAIHFESLRAAGPLVAVDCTSLPEALAESELYGHARGAFTDPRQATKGRFEQADGGTLFLDEIGDMPKPTQARFLRVLEERRVTPLGSAREVPVDVRVVSATNQDLAVAAGEGRFRQDLYYRVNTVQIHVPALRERPEDIASLAEHFVARFSRELRKPLEGLTQEATEMLARHGFPGNVRELRNLIEQAAIFCRGQELTAADLRPGRFSEGQSDAESGSVARLPSCVEDRADLCLSSLEKRAIEDALRRTEGHLHQAADLLGLSRFALKRRMERYRIE